MLSGISLGGQYALIAIGYTMVYGILRLINFAHGDVFMVAGLLGIFVGGFGIHNFYLGNISIGVIQIIVTLVTCGLGSLWGFIEGILILSGRITVDGEGKPLAP